MPATIRTLIASPSSSQARTTASNGYVVTLIGEALLTPTRRIPMM
ncbi:MAG TPA: hypothetical protein VIO16_07020 [Dehalococcoidia bacterium]